MTTRPPAPPALQAALLAALLLLLLQAPGARAFVYSFPHDLAAMPAVVFREGPMYASGKGPLGETGASTIALAALGAPAGPPPANGRTAAALVLNVAFADALTWKQLAGPPNDATVVPPFTPDYLMCCTADVLAAGGCGAGVGLGGLVTFPASADPAVAAAARAPVVQTFSAGAGASPGAIAALNASASFGVVLEGMQYVAILACDAKAPSASSSLPLPP